MTIVNQVKVAISNDRFCLIPDDIKNNLDIKTYRKLNKDDKVEAYFERNNKNEWVDCTDSYLQWQKESEEFIKKNGKLGNKKKSENRSALSEEEQAKKDELIKAQQLLADLLKGGNNE